MTVKEHYDNHLGKYYSWMAGNITEKQVEHQQYFAKTLKKKKETGFRK